MPRLGDTFHNVFDSNGRFVGFANDVPRTKELIVKNLQVKEAQAFRVKMYQRPELLRRKLVKQPKIHFSYNNENLFIIDRRVCWDLIRNFDPSINYRIFLEMLDYFSLYKILEDYLLDFSDKTISVWTMQSTEGHTVITAIQRTEMVSNLIHEEIINYVKTKTQIDAHESFFKVGKSVGSPKRVSPTALKRFTDVYLRIIKADMIFELQEQVGDGYAGGDTRVRLKLLKEVDDGMVQMMPMITFARNLESVDSEILYGKLDDIINLMNSTFVKKESRHIEFRKKGMMSEKEWNTMQYLWFVNSFSKVEE